MAEEEDIFLEDINEYVEQAAKTAGEPVVEELYETPFQRRGRPVCMGPAGSGPGNTQSGKTASDRTELASGGTYCQKISESGRRIG